MTMSMSSSSASDFFLAPFFFHGGNGRDFLSDLSFVPLDPPRVGGSEICPISVHSLPRSSDGVPSSPLPSPSKRFPPDDPTEIALSSANKSSSNASPPLSPVKVFGGVAWTPPPPSMIRPSILSNDGASAMSSSARSPSCRALPSGISGVSFPFSRGAISPPPSSSSQLRATAQKPSSAAAVDRGAVLSPPPRVATPPISAISAISSASPLPLPLPSSSSLVVPSAKRLLPDFIEIARNSAKRASSSAGPPRSPE